MWMCDRFVPVDLKSHLWDSGWTDDQSVEGPSAPRFFYNFNCLNNLPFPSLSAVLVNFTLSFHIQISIHCADSKLCVWQSFQFSWLFGWLYFPALSQTQTSLGPNVSLLYSIPNPVVVPVLLLVNSIVAPGVSKSDAHSHHFAIASKYLWQLESEIMSG